MLTCGLWGLLLFNNPITVARDIQVQADSTPLQNIIQQAQNGDRLLLASGTYYGSLVIDKPLSLIGNHKSIIDGQKDGHVITITASDVLIKNLQIQNSGNKPVSEDSGIFVTREAKNVIINNNYLQNNLIGIYLKGAKSAQVRNNTIIGSQFHRINDRGNGVYLWNSPAQLWRKTRFVMAEMEFL